ncbi:MAG: DUF86 domain-containing protein [Candidatus Electrothrix sp. MAN1_4]|nr:DUF86 domain-containing protein [Candidatus Electrothrix sp. MAN1_4]
MDKDIELWLHDMLVAIDEIFDFLPDPRNYIEFEKDLKTRRAVERNIEILGEAMHRILKTDPEFNIANARRIVDTRNRVIHGYDTVSTSIIWAIAVRELPKLREEIVGLLEKWKGD